MEDNRLDKIKRLYELYEQPMYRIAFAVLHSSQLAEDAVHDAFVKIIGKLDKLGSPDSPGTKKYIVKAVKSTSITIYRRNRKRSEYETPINDETMQIPDPSALTEERFYGRELLNSISDTDRRIVSLRCGNGMSWKDVADEVSMKEPAVRKRFERIKRKLKGGMDDET